MLNSDQVKNIDYPEAISELDKAKDALYESIRFVFILF